MTTKRVTVQLRLMLDNPDSKAIAVHAEKQYECRPGVMRDKWEFLPRSQVEYGEPDAKGLTKIEVPLWLVTDKDLEWAIIAEEEYGE